MRIVLAKAGHVSIIRPAETIDRLVLVTHHKEISPVARQQLDQLVLGHIRILPLIHEDKGVAALVLGPGFSVPPEQLHRLHQQVIEIQGAVLGQQLLVALVDPLCHLLTIGAGPHLGGGDKLILGIRDLAEHRPGAKELVIQIQAADSLSRQAELISAVIDDILRRDAGRLGILTQDTRADGVERTYGQLAKSLAQQEVEPVLHLPGSLVGKGHGHNLPGRHVVLLHQVGHPVGQHPGLAAAGSGEHQHRTVHRLHCLSLGAIQPRQNIGPVSHELRSPIPCQNSPTRPLYHRSGQGANRGPRQGPSTRHRGRAP